MVQGARGMQSTSVGMASRFLDDTDPACAVEVDAPAAVRGEIRRVLVGGLRVEGAFVIVSLRVRFGGKICGRASQKRMGLPHGGSRPLGVVEHFAHTRAQCTGETQPHSPRSITSACAWSPTQSPLPRRAPPIPHTILHAHGYVTSIQRNRLNRSVPPVSSPRRALRFGRYAVSI